MAEYIKREDAIDTLGEGIKKYLPNISEEVLTPLLVRVMVLPSIDIVHCSECEYQHKAADGFCWCNRAVDMSDCNGDACVVADDDNYCSYGERKGNQRGDKECH